MRPVYENDCKMCVFLGHKSDHDVYACSQGSKSHPTIIARYGDDPSHYASGLDVHVLTGNNRDKSPARDAICWGLVEAVYRGYIEVRFIWTKED